MKYSQEEIIELENIVTLIDSKNKELFNLKCDLEIILKSDDLGYPVEFFFRGPTHTFEVLTSTIIDFYNTKIDNLTNEIESLEKRLQKLVK